MTAKQRRTTVIPRPTRPVLEILRRAIVLPEDETLEITLEMFESLSLGDYQALARGVEELNPGALEYTARKTRSGRKKPDCMTWL
jgi:hypothetical protein